MLKFHYRDAPSASQQKAFEKYLSEDEELVLVTGFSGAYLRQEFIILFLFPGIIFGVVNGAVGWAFGMEYMYYLSLSAASMLGFAILKTWHLYHSNRYILTTRRVLIKKGIFGVKLFSAMYDKITHIEVDQSFIDRLLLHHGDIIVNTAGMNNNSFRLHYVDYPIELKNLLERLINREREQLGRKYESLSAVEGEIVD